MRTHRIVVGFITLSLMLAACGDDDASTTTVAPATTAVATTAAPTPDTSAPAYEAPPGGAGDDWAPEFIESFMAGCTAEASAEQCQCMLEEFQDRYAFDEFLAWAFEAAPDDPRTIEVTDICAR
jgi:hypothetical protein